MKAVKVVELKRLEQKNKMMEKYVQKLRKVARGSEYEKRLLIEEFKQEMNGGFNKNLQSYNFLVLNNDIIRQ